MGVTKSFLIFTWVWNAVLWDVCLGGYLGTRYITSFLSNYGTTGQFQLQISVSSDHTSVMVSSYCYTCHQSKFEKKVLLDSGHVGQIDLPKSVEIRVSDFFSDVVLIEANKEVSVVSLNSKQLSTDVAALYPVSDLGNEYYVVAPSRGPRGAFPQFSVLTDEGPNTVDIYVKGQVTFKGKIYSAGTKLTVTLSALQGILLQGTGDISGTRIVSQLPVAVLAGHVCSWMNTKCNHVFEQLLPVSSWGKTFLVPPLPWQEKSDILYISASQRTVLNYQVGGSKQKANLQRGDTLQILVLSGSPVYLTATESVQALFYSTGATNRTFSYDTFLMGIPDIKSYCPRYTVNGQNGFENYALFIMKTSEIGGLIVDRRPVAQVRWSQIPDSEFSWGLYALSEKFRSYNVAHPTSPFGLLSLGIANQNSYGTSGTCVEKLTCSNTQCQVGMVCEMINGQPQCVPSSEATCWAWGDPHYKTFDGLNYDFQGTCTYTVVKTCSDNYGLPFFHVTATNENRGNKRVSYVAMVSVEVYGHIITAFRSETGFVRVNGIRTHLPVFLNNGSLRLTHSGTSVILATEFKLSISYDWNQQLRVTISSAYHGGVCGLCGNNNGDKGDDFQTPAGTVAPNAIALGSAWAVKSKDDSCWHDCHGECKPCPSGLAKKFAAESYCGQITKVSNGPFTPCHAKVDPTTYFESCVYDLCSNEGHRQSLCDALKAYADTCQREGIQISEWRESAGCPLECPPNSKYQLCGTACPATCAGDKAESPCQAPCMESCQCKEGFVLSQGKCVPQSSCGCLYNGRPYAPGESFWDNEICAKRCTCNPDKREVECAAGSCKPSELCKVVNGVRGCYPASYGTCSAQGDPHYLTFDNFKFDFQGVCVYVFAELCHNAPADLEEFHVYVQNEHRGSRAVSFTRRVDLHVRGAEITISRQFPGRILVNGLLTYLPYSTADGKIDAYKKGRAAMIQVDFGLTVSFNWESRATVTVPSIYASALCGLCGNFNGNQADDALVPGSIPVPRKPLFDIGTGSSDCNEVIEPKCPGLATIAEQQRASGRYCGLIVAEHGPFQECHGHVDQEGAFQDCIYDYCFFKGHYTFTCAAIANYAAACQALGVSIHAWRSSAFCPPSCPVNSHYELCPKDCPQTCSSLYVKVPCLAKCEEDCVCNEGFVVSSTGCVPIADCGCFSQGRYYPVGELFYPTCQERCKCQAGGDVACEVISCGLGEECKIVDGTRKCYPTGNATCSALGDPHYRSFDGLPFDFQGTCTYFLVKSEPSGNLQPFSVIVENEAFGNGRVSVTKMVSVDVYNTALTLMQNRKGLVKVNGIFCHLPVTLLNGDLRVAQHGANVVIETSFGLSVSYDLVYNVRVTVPSSYQGQLGGLCGNYNGKVEDEFQLPNGHVVSDVAVFGAAWKIPFPSVSCTDGCSGKNCPVCEKEKKELFEQPSYCGLLTASDGPFRACHAVVDPSTYLDNCIFDLCMGDGDHGAMCQNIQSYVTACQEAGVSIQPWRSPSFCPLSCPANSHYDICSNLCKTHCSGITDNFRCPETCAEGCQCEDDFFFDGHKCVSLDACGCFEHGRYFQPNESVLMDNCTMKCTCEPVGFLCDTHACSLDETCEVKDGIMECYNQDPCKAKICRLKETCQVMEGQAQCVPDYVGTCWGWGDPHYHTFDGFSYDFQGTCTYVLSHSKGSSDGLLPFSVEAKNENRGKNKAVSYVQQVTVHAYDHEINIRKNERGRVRVNGVLTNLPVSLEDGLVRVTLSGNRAVVQTSLGLVVMFEWGWRVELKLPSSYFNKVGGLCGNFNQLPDDEQTAPDGTPLTTVAKWAATWVVEDGDLQCVHECLWWCKTCEGSSLEKYQVEGQCGVISAPEGPFKDCHSAVDPKIFLHNCAYDVCMNGGDHDILCQAVESYAQACYQEGCPVGEWRTPVTCPVLCPENSHYEACGNACHASCSDPDAPSACQEPCVETCQCNDGYVLSVDKCVPVESCGCTYNGFYYKPGEEFWVDNCGSLCRCDPSEGMVICKPAGCKANEKCATVNGVQGCHPLRPSTCTSSEDYYFSTFDGQTYEFKGTCLYQLVAVCSGNPTLTSFDIFIQHSPLPEGRAVTCLVSDVSITLHAGQWDKVQVNGSTVDLPFSHGDRVHVNSHEDRLAIVTNFGLSVELLKENLSVVTSVPGSYAGALCGLCGNANGDSDDDKTGKYGEDWHVGCVPGCSQDCPPCTLAELESYREQRYCGLLNQTYGPLASCLHAVPIASFFNDCVHKTCEVRGTKPAWCDVIATYVAVCQAKAVPVREWRTDTFCPYKCPAYSHYELCGSRCPVSCENLTTSVRCEDSCSEGCFCDAGFIRDGNDCVPLSECGCQYKGKYYKKGEQFFSNALCRERCQCLKNGLVQCRDDICSGNYSCKIVDGVPTCFPTEHSTCYSLDSQNYITFDGVSYALPVSCSYVLAQSVGQHIFSIVIVAESHNTMELHLQLAEYKVVLQRGRRGEALVNGERVLLPMALGDVWVSQVGQMVVLSAHTDLRVYYDLGDWVAVFVSGMYQGLVKGLCGNYNGDKNDEFLRPDGEKSQNAAEFGSSWRAEGSICADGCEDKCHTCAKDSEVPYESGSYCGALRANPGPFVGCHSLIDPDPFFRYCVANACTADGAMEVFCPSFQAYASACQAAGATIEAWRTEDYCPPDCLPGTHYETCARSCNSTCAGALPCVDPCFEGCVCDAGTLANGAECVRAEQCGCWHNGRLITQGQSILFPDCRTLCTCQKSGSVFCVDQRCGDGDICGLRDGVRDCFLTEGHCVLKLGAQFSSFDGLSGKVPAPGIYQLASLCDMNSDDWFRVLVGVTSCPPNGTAATLVYVFFKGVFIAVNGQKEAWMNGLPVLIPSNVTEAVTFDLTDNGIVMHSAQVQVILTQDGRVVLTVAPALAGKTCGACGNFNKDQADDLKTPGGVKVQNVPELLRSWTAKDFTLCAV